MSLDLFPSQSMSNYSCRSLRNADWGHDTIVPNLVVLGAVGNIKKGEEIHLRHWYSKIRSKNIGKR